MKVELKLSDDSDAHVIRNLWPLYVHDVSVFDGGVPNRHGVLIDNDGVTSLDAQGVTQQGWWQKPDVLFPYLVLVDGAPAGFNLIARGAFDPDAIKADMTVFEFFVVHAFRGKGVAEQAAAGFARHPGTWEVVTHPPNVRAIAFWRRVIARATIGDVREEEVDHAWGRKVAFTFSNS